MSGRRDAEFLDQELENLRVFLESAMILFSQIHVVSHQAQGLQRRSDLNDDQLESFFLSSPCLLDLTYESCTYALLVPVFGLRLKGRPL